MRFFGGEDAPREPERYRMPLAFCQGPRHPAPVRRDPSLLGAAVEAVAVGAQEAPQVEMLAAPEIYVPAAVAESPLDVQGIVQGRAARRVPAIQGLSSSRLGAVH